jgi:RHS repeat-associated protein
MKASYINFLKVLFTVFGLISATDYALSQTITSWSYNPVTTSTYCSPHTQNYTVNFSSSVSATLLEIQIRDQNDILVASSVGFSPSSGSSTYFNISVAYDSPGTKYLWVYVDDVFKGKSKGVVVTNGASINPGAMNDPSGFCYGSTVNMQLLNYTGSIVRWESRPSGGSWTNITNTTNTYATAVYNNTDFRVLLQNDCGLSGYSDIGTASPNPQVPRASLSISAPYFCSADPAYITATANFGVTVPSYNVEMKLYDQNDNWVETKDFENAPFSSSYTTTFSNISSHGFGSYYVRVVYATICVGDASTPVSYNLVPDPVINNSISISFPACPGCTTSIGACNTESFIVNASWPESGSTALKWYQGSTLIGSGSSIEIHPDQYTINPPDAISFKVEGEKSNSCGVKRYTSQNFTVNYSNKAVSTSITPTSYFCKDLGGSLSGSASAPGSTSITYNWQIDGTFTNVNSTSYSVSGLSAGQHTAVLRATATYAGVCLTTITQDSPAHTFTVYGQLNSGTVPASYGPVCSGTTVTFNASAASGSSSPYSYQWERWNGTGWENIPSATTEDYAATLSSYLKVRRRVTDTNCAVTKYTSESEAFVDAPPSIGTLSRNVSQICGSGPVNLSLSAATGQEIRWYMSSQIGAGAWSSWGSPIATGTGLTVSGYTVTNPNAQTMKFRFKAIAEGGACADVETTVGALQQVTVYPEVLPGTIVGFGDEGYGMATGHLEVQDYQTSVVRWEESTDQIQWSTATQDSNDQPYEFSFENLNQTTWFRAFVSGTGCPEIETAPAVVTVYQVPLITITGSPFIPPGGATTIEVNDDYYSYQWYKNGVLMSGETGINVSLNEPDSYTIKVKATETSPEGESDPILIKSLYGIGQNVIGKTTFRVEGVAEGGNIYGMPLESYVQSLSYLDGLARPYQTIGLGTSPQQTDMIQSYKIEPHSNISTGYLPYASDQRLGAVRTTAINNQGSYATSEQYAFYTDTQNNVATSSTAYAQTESEASPLGRVKRQGAPDADWQLSTSHTVNYAYRTNTAADGVLQWSDAGPGSAYAANILSVNEVTDENGNKVLTFTDGRGRTVLKKVQLDATIGGQTVAYLETYYVYDKWSNLVYQVPPKAVALLAQSATWDQAFKDEWVFQYVYDDKFRLIEKKTPDADWTYVAYDPLNRPVLVQDANLRISNKWYFTKWDEKGRAIMSGVYQNNTQTSRSAIQSLLDGLGYISGSQKWYEKKQGSTTHGYSNQAFPTTGAELLTVMYYDNHDLDANGSADRSYQAQGMTNETSPWPYLENQATASKKKLIGTSTETWLYEYYFYDKRGRATQVQSTNHLYTSAPDNIITMVYAFDGLLERQKTVHKAGATSITINNRYEYDHVGRLRKVYQKNNADAEQLVAAYEYNLLGQLERKKLHGVNLGQGGGSLKRNGKMYAHEIESDNYTGESEYVASHKITLKPGFSFKAENGKTFHAYLDDAQVTQLSETVAMQAVDYTYNTRGWLKTINDPNSLEEADPDIDQDDFFGMELLYNTTESGLNTNAYFNGNIAAVKWNTAGEQAGSAGPKGFAFTYDKSDKLGQASFKHDSANWISPLTNGLNETMTYDHNGNIASLNRNEIDQWTGNASQVDQLTYDYSSGNQLTEVTDGSGTTGFADAADAANEMGYDANGNLVQDLNKDITGITYNILNKPETITFGDGRLVKYTYDATGAKIKMAFYSDATTLEKIIDYVGGFEYHDNTLRYFASPEGRVVNKGGELVYEYALADHQGNTRAVFTSEPDEVTTTTTLETAHASTETLELTNYGDITFIQNTDYNHTPGGSYSNRVSGSQTEIVGMARVLQVYPGDQAQIEVYAKYTQPTTNDSQVAAFLASAALTNFTDFGFNGTETSLATSSFNQPNLFGNGPWVTGGTLDENLPKGRLNFIVFDRDFIPVDWGFKQISIAALETGSGGPHEKLYLEVPNIPVAGYLYVYVSNENDKLVNIYFDDLKVTHLQNPLMQTTDYYPFGAVASTSWTRETATPNPYLYNAGSELNEKTGWYETALRGYDPYLGRFNGVDPMASKYAGCTPYNFAFNSPAVFNDPTGADPYQRADDTPWAAARGQRGRYDGYNDFGDFAYQNQTYGGFGQGSWNWTGMSEGDVYGGSFVKYGPGDGGALNNFLDATAGRLNWKAQVNAIMNDFSAVLDSYSGYNYVVGDESNRHQWTQTSANIVFTNLSGTTPPGAPPIFEVYDFLPGERDAGTQIQVLAGGIVAFNIKKMFGVNVNPMSEVLWEKYSDINGNEKQGRPAQSTFVQSFGFSRLFVGGDYKRTFVSPDGIFHGHYPSEQHELSIGISIANIKLTWDSVEQSLDLFYGLSLGGTVGGGIGVDIETWEGSTVRLFKLK